MVAVLSETGAKPVDFFFSPLSLISSRPRISGPKKDPASYFSRRTERVNDGGDLHPAGYTRPLRDFATVNSAHFRFLRRDTARSPVFAAAPRARSKQTSKTPSRQRSRPPDEKFIRRILLSCIDGHSRDSSQVIHSNDSCERELSEFQAENWFAHRHALARPSKGLSRARNAKATTRRACKSLGERVIVARLCNYIKRFSSGKSVAIF